METFLLRIDDQCDALTVLFLVVDVKRLVIEYHRYEAQPWPKPKGKR